MTLYRISLRSAFLLAIVVVAGRLYGQLTTLPAGTLSEPRALILSSATLGTRVYFAGGGLTDGTHSKKIDIYDNSTNTWTSTEHELSVPRRDLVAVSTEAQIFFAGGQGFSGPSDVIDIYNSTTGIWSVTHLPGGARYSLSATRVGDWVVFAGGQTATNTYSNVVDIYNVKAGTWSMVQLSEAKSWVATAGLNGKVYFAGGQKSGGVSSLIEIYNLNTNAWETPITLSVPRHSMAGIAAGGKLFFAGGRMANQSGTDQVDLFDGATWSSLKLSLARFGLSATTADNKVFFVAGHTSPANVTSNVVDIYDLKTSGFVGSVTLSAPRNAVGAASVGTKAIFASGWQNGALGFVNVVDVYDPPVEIQSSDLPEVFAWNDPGAVASITVDNAEKVKQVVIKVLGLSQKQDKLTTDELLVKDGNTFRKVFKASDLTDPIGVRYQFVVTDFSGRTKSTSQVRANIRYLANSEEQIIPYTLKAGNTQDKYQIISIPLTLANDDPADVFDELGEYNKKTWRLFEFQSTPKYREYKDGLSRIVPGKGYWLIVKDAKQINPGEGVTLSVSGDPLTHAIELTTGWNLIGNPFDFDLEWSNVLSSNPTASGIVGEQVMVYNGGNTFESSGTLGKYRGGFVHSSQSFHLKIPALDPINAGGRKASTPEVDLDTDEWQLSVSVDNGQQKNSVGGIGMNPGATILNKDRFDILTVPMLPILAMPEITFPHPEILTDFSREVVPPASVYTWEFRLRNPGSQALRLEWDNQSIKPGDKKLYLFDAADLTMKDMTETNYHIVPEGASKMKIIYGTPRHIEEMKDELLPVFGTPFPNPATTAVTIPFHISEAMGDTNVSIHVFDALGKRVTTLVDGVYATGDHAVVWNADAHSRGLYLVSVQANDVARKWVKIQLK